MCIYDSVCPCVCVCVIWLSVFSLPCFLVVVTSLSWCRAPPRVHSFLSACTLKWALCAVVYWDAWSCNIIYWKMYCYTRSLWLSFLDALFACVCVYISLVWFTDFLDVGWSVDKGLGSEWPRILFLFVLSLHWAITTINKKSQRSRKLFPITQVKWPQSHV